MFSAKTVRYCVSINRAKCSVFSEDSKVYCVSVKIETYYVSMKRATRCVLVKTITYWFYFSEDSNVLCFQ